MAGPVLALSDTAAAPDSGALSVVGVGGDAALPDPLLINWPGLAFPSKLNPRNAQPKARPFHPRRPLPASPDRQPGVPARRVATLRKSAQTAPTKPSLESQLGFLWPPIDECGIKSAPLPSTRSKQPRMPINYYSRKINSNLSFEVAGESAWVAHQSFCAQRRYNSLVAEVRVALFVRPARCFPVHSPGGW